MNKNFSLYIKKDKIVHAVALVLIVCMGLVDISMYLGYSLQVNENNVTASGVHVITENHEIDLAMADGVYDGSGSDSSNSHYEPVDISEGKYVFNILEILPTERKAVIGYTIGGYEPFVDAKGLRDPLTGEYIVSPQQMRAAYMDALINPNPGEDKVSNVHYSSENSTQDDGASNSQNTLYKLKYYPELKLMNEGFSDSGIPAFRFESAETDWSRHTGFYNGYYKYIGHNMGVYSCVSKDPTQKKAVMHSRFYYDSEDKNGDGSIDEDYDYIFVYSEEESGNPDDIYVKEQKKLKYINEEKFLKECYGLTDDPTTTNVDEIQEWKNNHAIEVVTRTPQNTTYEDIERADVIVLNSGGNKDMRYYANACKLYNKINNVMHKDNIVDVNTDLYSHFYNPETDDPVGADGNTVRLDKAQRIDFDEFLKVIRIYERVVMRKDVAFIASKTVYNNTSGEKGGKLFNNNVGKLMCMLFFVVKQSDQTPGVGREFFMDFMKRYTSNPGDYTVGYNADDTTKTYWDLWKDNKLSFKAPTLRNNEINYMHYHYDTDNHPGHPLTVNRESVITGGHYDTETGNLVPETDGTVYKRTIRRGGHSNWWDQNSAGEMYFKNAGDAGYYYNEQLTDWGDTYIDGDKAWAHPWCLNGYESMSNTTDFMYIDDDGNLHRDAKYSGDNGYWYKIDMDDGDGWYAYKKLKWDEQTWEAWPFTDRLYPWVMERGTYERSGSDTGNMHLYYDYYDPGFPPYDYKGINDIGGDIYADTKVPNQSVAQESGLFKNINGNNLFKSAIQTRSVEREKTDERHKAGVKRDYYISMNILNGDGVNKRLENANKNKVLYYNVYEIDDIKKYEELNVEAKIPIRIRFVSSCPLKEINISDKDGTIATYTYDKNTTGKMENSKTEIDCTGSAGKTLKLKRADGTYETTTGVPKLSDGTDDKTPLGAYKYTYEGLIYDVTCDHYLGKRNEEIKVKMTVEGPDGEDKVIDDIVTIVRRDFFMLD